MRQDDTHSSRYHIQDIEKLDPNDSHRIILELIGDAENVLDVGCSTGFLGAYLKSVGKRAVGVESNAAAAAEARPHYESVIAGDIADPDVLAQLGDGTFDVIILGDVIEHLLDPWSLVKNIAVKLRGKGSLIVSVPHLGHASVIAALISETFQYRDVGLLDRTHFRFFSLQSLFELVVNAGLTPCKVERVMHNTFSTEIPLATDLLPAELFPVLDRCPETRTYQFVVKAVKSRATEPLDFYISKFSLPLAPAPEKDAVVQSYVSEMEAMRKQVREAREYISVCMKTIKEKDDSIGSLQNTISQNQAENEQYRGQIAEYQNVSGNEASERAAARIESRLRDIHRQIGQGQASGEQPLRIDVPYDILIPIYNAHDHVKKCVESVLIHTDPIHRVYLLDDASTDSLIPPLLQSFAARDSRVHVLQSEKNRGFIENINRGFALSRNPVVILNSDTEVTADWLERMHRCHQSGPLVGIVCPLSNNATILSVPVMNTANKLPENITPDRFARLVADCSHLAYRRIPTAVGFCMSITRSVLDQVGNFDPAFGLGYGEENDFCERAKQHGFEIVCCDDAYVHHYGEASFSSVSQINDKRANNMKLLNTRWPQYLGNVLAFCRSNPLRDVQERIYHALRGSRGMNSTPSILHVIHNFDAPGGTELHTRNIIDRLSQRVRSTVIFPSSQPALWSDQASSEPADYLRIVKVVKELSMAREFFLGFGADLANVPVEENFARFVSGGDYDIVHFQHLIDWDTLMLPFIAKSFGKKVILSLHDYYLLCPEYNFLLPGNQKQCGKSRADGNDIECLYCLGSKRVSTVRKTPMDLPEYLTERLGVIHSLFDVVDVVIAPSTFVKSKFVAVFGAPLAEKCIVIRHGVESLEKSPRPDRAKKFRVGFLGNATDRKGIMVFLSAARALKKSQVQFEIFGGIPAGLVKIMNELGVIMHGGYRRQELPGLLSKIDLVVIPSTWDETFCLTLSEAQAMGVPVLASDAGAISERIREGETGFFFPVGDAARLASRILALSADPRSLLPVISGLAFDKARTIEENASEYGDVYAGLSRNVSSVGAKAPDADIQRSLPALGMETVSIVILTFNQLDYTKVCVASIKKNTPGKLEIIFVDNGSSDGTVAWLKRLIKDEPKYRLIENKKNFGFSKGCNQGIQASNGEYILLLNNDVVVTEHWLSGMLDCLNTAPDTGIVGPMTNNISGIQKVPNVGYNDVANLDAYAAAFREKHLYRRIPARRIVGFCMLFRRGLVDKIGLLDESFGSGNFEDDDFCFRAALAGYRNMIAGDVFIHHYGSRSFIGNGIHYSTAMSGNRKLINAKWSGIKVNTAVGRNLAVIQALEKADEHHQKERTDKAVAILIDAIKHAPADTRIFTALAHILLESKQFEQALDALGHMPLDDQDPIRTCLAGYCKEGVNLLNEASELADKALSIRPGYAPAINLKGVIAFRNDDRAAAEALFRKALEADPGFGEACTNLGVLLWSSGDHQAGLEFLERGFILAPASPDAMMRYHTAATALGVHSRAEIIFREACSLRPHLQKLCFLLIDLLLRQEKYREAMVLIQEAMTISAIDDGILAAALDIRAKIGPKDIEENGRRDNALSVCMIVRNEEANLARSLMSISSLADEIIVVDTGSTDRTKELAAAFGAKVSDVPWRGDFSEARNASIEKATGNWILVLDADEVISPLDHAALKQIVSSGGKALAAYSLTTRNYVKLSNMGGWTANDGSYTEESGSGWYPSAKVRLFRKDPRIRFENRVHELVEPSLTRLGARPKPCHVPIHHYGKLEADKVTAKGEEYFRLGREKLLATSDPKALYELAVQAGELDRFTEAIDLWQQFLRLPSPPPELVLKAYINAGHAYLQAGRYDEAFAASKHAIEHSPDAPDAVMNYALSELWWGEPDRAVPYLKRLLKDVPHYAPAIGMLEVAALAAGETGAAGRLTERLKARGFSYEPYLLDHARKLIQAGRPDRASIILETTEAAGLGTKSLMSMLAECRKHMVNPLVVPGGR